jgi:hypothetical protein
MEIVFDALIARKGSYVKQSDGFWMGTPFSFLISGKMHASHCRRTTCEQPGPGHYDLPKSVSKTDAFQNTPAPGCLVDGASAQSGAGPAPFLWICRPWQNGLFHPCLSG